MKGPKKTFMIYCSDGASRIRLFYSSEYNLKTYKPRKVIYDGDNEDVISELRYLFEDDLILFNERSEMYDTKRINSSTSEFIHSILRYFSIDYLLCFGNRILKKELIEDYSRKLINFHPSLLPSFKGLLAVNQSLEFAVSILGNTAHFIDEGIDTGEIVLQTAMLSEDFEDFEDVLELQFPMMKMIFRDLLNFELDDKELFNELNHRVKPYLIPKTCKI